MPSPERQASPYALTVSTDPSGVSSRVGDLETPLDALDFTHRYAIEHALGEGGMGRVVLLKDAQIGRSVALKVMRTALATEATARARFVREARIQGQLEHPAIVPVYDLGIDPHGSIYFTMKRVRGMTLLDILHGVRDGLPGFAERFTRRRLLTAFDSVCLAIDFAHERGVVHRDLKPDNIMLGDFGEVYVLDWGVAKLQSEVDRSSAEPVELPSGPPRATGPGAMLGTPGYMAPEQVRGEHGTLGPEADVYALGAILFELLTHEPLHRAGDAKAVLASTLAGADARPSVRAPEREVAPELEAICVKATALDARARHPSARDLHLALDSYLEGERDIELRRERASVHARTAADAAERAARPGGAIDDRRQAMRQIGRALALDPDNREAAATLVRLLTVPPAELPPEVRVELDRSAELNRRRMGRVGAITYMSVLVYIPLLLWLGVRSWLGVAGLVVPLAVAAAVCFYQYKRAKPSDRIVFVTMFLSNLAFAFGSVFYGPLVVVPVAIAINTTAYAVHLEGRGRRLAVAIGCISLLVPVLLQVCGVVPASYVFQSGAMSIVPHGVSMPETATLVVLTFSGLIGILTGAFAVAHVRDALSEAERHLYLYTWHLREFVPEGARPATDPSNAKRKGGSKRSTGGSDV